MGPTLAPKIMCDFAREEGLLRKVRNLHFLRKVCIL